MTRIWIVILGLVAAVRVQATEPLFVLEVNEETVVLEEVVFATPEELKKRLDELDSPDEVMLHIHACTSAHRFSEVMNALLPEYKSKVWVHGTKYDAVCG